MQKHIYASSGIRGHDPRVRNVQDYRALDRAATGNDVTIK